MELEQQLGQEVTEYLILAREVVSSGDPVAALMAPSERHQSMASLPASNYCASLMEDTDDDEEEEEDVATEEKVGEGMAIEEEEEEDPDEEIKRSIPITKEELEQLASDLSELMRRS